MRKFYGSNNTFPMWGLISQNQIPIGVFVLKYIGQMIGSDLAQKRNQHYIENNLDFIYHIQTLQIKNKKLKSAFKDDFIAIDATFYGNESRFINHSCNPNLKPIKIQRGLPNEEGDHDIT